MSLLRVLGAIWLSGNVSCDCYAFCYDKCDKYWHDSLLKIYLCMGETRNLAFRNILLLFPNLLLFKNFHFDTNVRCLQSTKKEKFWCSFYRSPLEWHKLFNFPSNKKKVWCTFGNNYLHLSWLLLIMSWLRLEFASSLFLLALIWDNNIEGNIPSGFWHVVCRLHCNNGQN